jgi:hypothetical protein
MADTFPWPGCGGSDQSTERCRLASTPDPVLQWRQPR